MIFIIKNTLEMSFIIKCIGNEFYYKNQLEMIFIMKNTLEMSFIIKLHCKWFLL